MQVYTSFGFSGNKSGLSVDITGMSVRSGSNIHWATLLAVVYKIESHRTSNRQSFCRFTASRQSYFLDQFSAVNTQLLNLNVSIYKFI